MSKYPYIIFLSLSKYSDLINNIFNENKDKLECTPFFTNDFQHVKKLFNSNYQILVTYGDSESEYHEVNFLIPERLRARWIHFSKIDSITSFNRGVNYCFINICTSDRIKVRPAFSIFTTTYLSYDKIKRAYNSIKNQSFIDFEWVILDDSPDSTHFDFLIELFKNDFKVRLYKRNENSGNIGNVKNESIGLCRGKYILEMDHDDEILPDCLKDSFDYFESHPDVGFIYMDFINICENGTNFHYGDFICKGYGSYYSQKYNNKWVFVYNTPNVNNITLSHLVCCPNHPRIWNREILLKSGSYSEFLPVCDDYEILLRTFLTTKMAKIHKLGYVQYINDGNNNFSLIRNSEINRIGPINIKSQFYNTFNINQRCKEINAYEDETYIYHHSQIWNRNSDYIHKYANNIWNPNYTKQYCIIGVQTLYDNLEIIKAHYSNPKNDFLLLDSEFNIEYLWNLLDSLHLDRFKCYSIINTDLEKYFLFTYRSVESYSILK
jgi:glycosyltransferase involved in cell wall biosynthesis